jgi:hypothetical protein
MPTWATDELQRIGSDEELDVSSRVAVADTSTQEAVDAAYRYDTHPPLFVATVVGRHAHPTTLRIDPA